MWITFNYMKQFIYRNYFRERLLYLGLQHGFYSYTIRPGDFQFCSARFTIQKINFIVSIHWSNSILRLGVYFLLLLVFLFFDFFSHLLVGFNTSIKTHFCSVFYNPTKSYWIYKLKKTYTAMSFRLVKMIMILKNYTSAKMPKNKELTIGESAQIVLLHAQGVT